MSKIKNLDEVYSQCIADGSLQEPEDVDIEKAKSYLKKFKDQRSEIISVEDYKSVAPSIAMNYLTEGLNPIWDL